MIHQVCKALCLDSQGSTGPASEFSQAVSMEGYNSVQAELVLYAYTPGVSTALSVTTQVSNDGTNWQNASSAQATGEIGRTLLNAQNDVAASYVRLYFELAGTGKAVLDAHLAISSQ
ncbi:MAG: hypothetical protein AAF628_20575 [Planctomycetota bacterium]